MLGSFLTAEPNQVLSFAMLCPQDEDEEAREMSCLMASDDSVGEEAKAREIYAVAVPPFLPS